MITQKNIITAFFISILGIFFAAAVGTPEQKVPENPLPTPNANVPPISMSLTKSARTAQEEYLTINTSPSRKGSYLITGWELKNPRGGSYRLGEASSLPIQGQINSEQPVLVPQGSTVVVSSGRSPIGVSFRINACSGYLAEHVFFTPKLSGTCPQAIDFILPEELAGLEESCRNYIRNLPSCHDPIVDPEINTFSPACQRLLSNKVNYNNCVSRLSSTNNFYKNEWRMYLGSTNKIWDSAIEVISLFDNDGRLLGTISN